MTSTDCYLFILRLMEDVPDSFTIHDKCEIFDNSPLDPRSAVVLLSVSCHEDLVSFFDVIKDLPVYVIECRELGPIRVFI